MRPRQRLVAWPLAAALTLAGTMVIDHGSQARADHRTALYEGLSAADRAKAEENLQSALETRQSEVRLSWRRIDGAWGGTVMPLRTFRIESGVYCRDFQEDIISTGTPRSGTFTACRNGSGTWITVE